MEKIYRILMLGVLTGLLFCGILYAQEKDKGGEVSGTLVRLIEREVVEEGPDSKRTVRVRREVRRDGGIREKSKPDKAAERLGQMEKELREIISAHFERLAGEFRELRMRVAELERELQEVRVQNERLRRELRQRDEMVRERERVEEQQREEQRRREARVQQAIERQREELRRREERERQERERQREEMGRREARVREALERRREIKEREERERRREGEGQEGREVRRGRASRPTLPDGMVGFRGVLEGRILRKLDNGFVLGVEKVVKIWEQNKAEEPETAVGEELLVIIRQNEGRGRRFMDTLRDIETGERVLVEAFHFGGNRLVVVEQFEKIE